MAVCPNCNAERKIYGPPGVIKANTYSKTCPSCHGTGEVSGYWRKCHGCSGWGKVGALLLNPDPCPECNGRGIVPSRAPEESSKKRRGRSVRIVFD